MVQGIYHYHYYCSNVDLASTPGILHSSSHNPSPQLEISAVLELPGPPIPSWVLTQLRVGGCFPIWETEVSSLGRINSQPQQCALPSSHVVFLFLLLSERLWCSLSNLHRAAPILMSSRPSTNSISTSQSWPWSKSSLGLDPFIPSSHRDLPRSRHH